MVIIKDKYTSEEIESRLKEIKKEEEELNKLRIEFEKEERERIKKERDEHLAELIRMVNKFNKKYDSNVELVISNPRTMLNLFW